jgi:hypothetical protein
LSMRPESLNAKLHGRTERSTSNPPSTRTVACDGPRNRAWWKCGARKALNRQATVRGTLAPILEEFQVTFRVNHGYASMTALLSPSRESRQHAQPWRVLYVGDWDPSGLHMSEVDLPTRLWRYGGRILLARVALTEADIADPDLPDFDAGTKRDDTRWDWYTTHYGDRCWEVDALNPNVLRERVKQAIVRHINQEAWDRAGLGEEAEQEGLRIALENWEHGISGQAQK